MREWLNSNPLAQIAVVGVLLVATGFFVLSTTGGGEEEKAATETASVTATSPDGSVSVTATATATSPDGEAGTGGTPTSVPPLPPSAAASAPPLPSAVTEAFDAGSTVVLLFVSNGGIDDRLVKDAVEALRSLPDASVFVVPAGRISRYAAIAEGVAVDRVPALVVIRPKRLGQRIPTASVYYGFQSPQSVRQAVIDAGYKGRTLDYHP